MARILSHLIGSQSGTSLPLLKNIYKVMHIYVCVCCMISYIYTRICIYVIYFLLIVLLKSNFFLFFVLFFFTKKLLVNKKNFKNGLKRERQIHMISLTCEILKSQTVKTESRMVIILGWWYWGDVV